MPNASVEINSTVQVKRRLNDQPFRPTVTNNEEFKILTDLENFELNIPAFATLIWTQITQERTVPGTELQWHCGVRIENVTHPTPAKGVVPLAKRHFDGNLSDLELTSETIIRDYLLEIITQLRQSAKY